MPPEPPKRQPSRPEIILDEQPERGVLEQRRFDLPKRAATLTGLPAPPALPLEHAVTKPAPRNPLEKQTWRLPTPPSALAHARRTDPPAASGPPPTSIRVPADEPAPESLRDGQEAVLRKALADEREKTRVAEARAQELERQARVAAETRSPNTFPPGSKLPEQSKAEETKPIVVDVPTPAAWKAALFKVVVGLGALLTAAATILGVRANTAIEPKVETNAVRTKVVETAADTLTERVGKLEAFARAETKRRQCVEAQLRDALARGTGHVLTTLPALETLWTEQNAPKAEARVLWKTPTWFTAQGCDAAPSPP